MAMLPHFSSMEIMTGPSYWRQQQLLLEQQLVLIRKEEIQYLRVAQRSLAACAALRDKVGESLQQARFTSAADEILFRKEIWPFFTSRVIFFTQALDLELLAPALRAAAYAQRLQDIARQYTQYSFLDRYLRAGSTYLDDRLFLLPEPLSLDDIQHAHCLPPEIAPDHCSDLVAQLIATRLLEEHVRALLHELQHPGEPATLSKPTLSWTDSKTGLIELAYAFQSAGVFNNGKVELKEIVDYLQLVFNINLNNYPRTFQEILSRKTGYTNLLDKLRDKLLLRIQQIEEKYDP